MTHEAWTQVEFEAAVDAYVSMLHAERDGTPFVKADVRRALQEGALEKRSRSSIEKRFQNISYVLASAGEEWLSGYAPLYGVGPTGFEYITRRLAALTTYQRENAEPTADSELLRLRTTRHLGNGAMNWVPKGQAHPLTREVTSRRFCRDSAVIAYVLQAANGECEACSSPAPFLTAEGEPYLEVHHVKPLAEGGSDTISNAAALCPNCHRAAHLAVDAAEIRISLVKRIDRLKAE